MGVQERRAREKKELRQEILDAARDLFLREGFEHVSMRKIAEKIEYSPTTIYLYFQDKADLVDCLCEETLARLVRKQTQIDEAIADPVERLRRCLRSYIEFGLKHPNHYKMSFMMSELFDDPDRAVRSRAMGERAFDHLRQGLAQCVQQKSIAVADIEATAQVLWATIHGLTSLLIAKPKFPWVERERLIDTLVENAINGLRCNTPA
ncbi:MAG: TetR/AcrR family transcriptional regulator [Bryobacteraceae bacterium]|jgi:AcrR family transcriptional regulator